MNILGISAFYHDSAACLVRDGKIIAAGQEERWTRKKHDSSFPGKAIDYCLKEAGLNAVDLDYVAFYDKPFIKFERLLYTYLSYAPRGLISFLKAMPAWINQKIWIKDIIAGKLKYKGEILFTEHHIAHAASAFFPSPFKEAAFLTIDGVGEWATAAFGAGENNRIKVISEIDFPHSLGLLYSAFTYYCGFKVNSGEYKLMGLAPYGEAKYKSLILDNLLDLKEDGSFKMNMDYFDYCAGLAMTNERFNRLFSGRPRAPESKLTGYYRDIARSAQEVTQDIMLKMARHVYKATGKNNLCLAGGVALNCVGNGKILREGPFKNIWVQPAAGDAGGALGAALFVWHQYLDNPRPADDKNDFMQGAYLGPAFDDEYIGRYLRDNRIPHRELEKAEIPEVTAKLLNDKKVIGWFQGRMEFGPRALGARSILGDARDPAMQETMNLKIKFRESFRPFAPSVLAEKCGDYFELDVPSPYMLLTAPVKNAVRKVINDADGKKEGWERLKMERSTIPAVTHVDYSARVHTVAEENNPLFYWVIKKFDELYGCAVVINTSFNVRGEPIACAPQDAYRCFMRTNMDYLLMGSFLLEKKEQKPLEKNRDWLREYGLD
jgi:carbamoyltransferase